MKFKHLLRAVLLITALYVATPLLADDELIGGKITDSVTAAAIEEYWTEERMRNAEPYPMHSPEGAFAESTPAGTIPNQADGEPESSPGGLPGFKESFSTNNFGSPELALLVGGLDNSSPGPHGYHWPFPFTHFEVNKAMYKKYPYKTVGRIFFTTASGTNSSCSGSSIGGRAVLTAGHCVSDGSGNWHSNWIFRPAYRDAGTITSILTWTAVQRWTYASWHNKGSFCRDVGFLITKNKNSGRLKLSQKVGWLGWVANFDSKHMHWNIFGYPAEKSRTNPQIFYKGKRMFESQASFARWTASWWDQTCKPLPQCAGSLHTGGSSGGPWIYRFDPTGGTVGLGGNFANSVTSTYYLPGRVSGAMCGPYFDTSVANFIKQMKAK